MLVLKNQKIFISVLLSCIIFYGFFQRTHNFIHTKERTIDEIAYYHLGLKVKEHIFEYHTKDLTKSFEAEGTILPDYFYRPLFKYPPLYTYFTAASLSIFGDQPLAAVYIPIIFGLLTIPLVYLMGELLFNSLIGFLAAIFVFIDPISIMTSQKIWMDAPMTFFMFLALYLFMLGLKKERSCFYIWSGFCSGLAILIKYPGFLVTVSILVYAIFYQRRLFKDKYFVWQWLLPIIMLIPWIFWNFMVYGTQLLSEQSELLNLKTIIPQIVFYCAVCTFFILFFIGHKKWEILNKISPFFQKVNVQKCMLWCKIIIASLLLLFMRKEIVMSLDLSYLPETSLFAFDLFQNENITFYFGRLVEYSFIYLFAFAALFGPNKNNIYFTIAKVYTIVIFVFYSVWGNYQCRYILSAIPLLLILGVYTWSEIFYVLIRNKSAYKQRGWFLVIIFLAILIVWRTHHINVNISYPNNTCYF